MDERNLIREAIVKEARLSIEKDKQRERREQREQFERAVESLREYCHRPDLAIVENRQQLKIRLISVAALCGGENCVGQLQTYPTSPSGVDWGIAVFSAALKAEISTVEELLETFAVCENQGQSQITMMKFLGNVGWLLWSGVSGPCVTSAGENWLGNAGLPIGENNLDPTWLEWSTFDGIPLISRAEAIAICEDRIEDLEQQIAQKQLKENEQVEVEAPAIADVDDENESGSWHSKDEDPPPEYKFGPYIGTKAELAKWIEDSNDRRSLEPLLENGVVWGRKENRTKFSAWLKSDARHKAAQKRTPDDRRPGAH